MGIKDTFDSGNKVRLYADRTLTGDLRNPHWEITFTKAGIRRLIRFLLAGGTRNYGNVMDTNVNIFKPKNINVRAIAIRGGSRATSRKLRKKINFKKTTVRIDGWYPKTDRKRVNALLEDAKSVASMHEEQVAELKDMMVRKAHELSNNERYRMFRYGSLMNFYEEHEGRLLQYSALTEEQKKRFLRWAAGAEPVKWNNLLESNVFDHTSRRLLASPSGTRVLMAMAMMGVLDRAEAVINDLAPTMNPVFASVGR